MEISLHWHELSYSVSPSDQYAVHRFLAAVCAAVQIAGPCFAGTVPVFWLVGSALLCVAGSFRAETGCCDGRRQAGANRPQCGDPAGNNADPTVSRTDHPDVWPHRSGGKLADSDGAVSVFLRRQSDGIYTPCLPVVGTDGNSRRELSYVLSADAGHRGGRLCGAPHLSNAPASDGSAARIQLLWDSTGISGAVGGLFRKLLRGECQCALWRRFARHVF